MPSLNKVALIGNLGSDPESRTTQDGRKVVTFNMATHESWTDKRDGNRVEKTEWHRIVIFNESLAEVAEKYLRKGRQVYLEGSLQTRKYADKSGTERSVTEVVLSAYRGELQMLGEPTG
jgi:single-strand DNA-binding protein